MFQLMKQILVEAFKLVDQSKLPILDKYNYIFKSNQITFIITKKWTSALVSEILESVLQTVQKNDLHIDSTYLQTVQKTMCKKTHTYTQYTQCTIIAKCTHLYMCTMYTFYIMYTPIHCNM